MEKMTRIAKNLNILAQVARKIFTVAAWIIAVCIVILLFVSPHHEMWQNADYTIRLGEVDLILIPDGAVPAEATRNRVMGGLILCIPLLLLAARCLGVVQEILIPMSQGKPFDRKVSENLRTLSFLVFIGGFLAEAGRMITTALILNGANLKNLFNPSLVAGYEVEITMNITYIFVFGVLHLLSYVFRYGEELQQLSDETL